MEIMEITYQTKRFIEEVLEGNEYDFMRHYPVVIDIGANIGTFSYWMKDHANIIYALEPAEENYNAMVKTIEKNKLTDKIKPFKIAISNSSNVKTMARHGEAGGGGWKIDEAGDYPVDARTLRDFMDSQGIEYVDLIKIDVEGHENEIFSAPFFPKDRIGTIVGECHPNTPDPRPQLEWLGFKYIDLGNNHFIARKI